MVDDNKTPADYIAYHSAAVMGRNYGPIQATTAFVSSKSEAFLQRAVGARVWVISSTKERGRTEYKFEGMFIPAKVRSEGESFRISGSAKPCSLRPLVTSRGWFRDLLKEQNNFSYGFNRIKDAKIVAQMQRLILHDGQETVSDPILEGAKLQGLANRYERNLLARRLCIEHYGYKCMVCDFDFGAVYGERGRGFINIHHLKPLASIGKEYKVDPIVDLRPICPNCHSMIHAGKEMLSVEALKKLMRLPMPSS